MVASVGADELRLVAQSYTTLCKHLFELLDLLEVAVC
jgi:hypothetical protein